MSSDLPISAQADAGSFRDRDGRVYLLGERVFRGLSARALEHFRALQSTGFYQEFSGRGELIRTSELPQHHSLRLDQEWAGVLEHERIAAVSYPYEWSFSMLREAAGLQLRLLEAALQEGWSMKDASPYNVQFVSGKAVFIDIPSLEPMERGQPWSGYRQFCEMNLFPLMLQAYKGIDFQPFLRSRIDGVNVQLAARMFGWRDRFRKGVTSHVWLQAVLDKKHGSSKRDLRKELGSAGFGHELILANVRKLIKLVAGLEWDGAGSEWGDYEEFHNYSETDHAAKLSFVEEAAKESQAQTAWDMGCNTGKFSAAVARHCPLVLAMDGDHLAVDRLFRNKEVMAAGHILPLVQNIADPSPNWGWRLTERMDLQSRARPGLILCLALVHHIVIGANVPLHAFIDWLASLGGDLVIEYVGRGDDKVKQLLRNRIDQYDDYHPDNFENCLSRHYQVVRKASLNQGNRVIYFCKNR